MKDASQETNPRQAWLSLLAKSPEGRIASLLDANMERPAFTWLRAPEIGSAMIQGRAGATGAPFNLGEMTVTRCALTLATGQVGHGYVQGRDKSHAEAAALVDALLQTEAAETLRTRVLAPIEAELTQAKASRAAKAAATKVDFFTMERGED